MSSWQILGIEPGSDEVAIKSAFRKKALKVHPDVGGSDEEFKKLFAAYEECLHEVEPELEINLNEIFGNHSPLVEIFRAMGINAYTESFGLDSLIGMKVRFTFDSTNPNYHYEDRRRRDELEKGDEQ